jgi:hypothetical protein
MYVRLLINMTIRISLDVSAGTFTKVEKVCRDEFQNKAQYLRMLVNNDLKERGR